MRMDMPKRLPSTSVWLSPWGSRTVPEPSISRWRLGSTSRAKMAWGGVGMTRSTVTTSGESLMGGMVASAPRRPP